MPWIKPQLCIACGGCLKECPVDAIYWWNAKAKIDKANCNGCGKCLEVCEQEAVRPDSEPEEVEVKVKYDWPF